jgi:site-specific recombinase XerD
MFKRRYGSPMASGIGDEGQLSKAEVMKTVENYLVYKGKREKKPRTINTYLGRISYFIDEFGQMVPDEALAIKIIESCKARGLKACSIRLYLWSVDYWYRAYHDGAHLEIAKPSVREHSVEFLKLSEVHQLLGYKNLSLRDHAVLVIMLTTGIRRREGATLNMRDLDLKNGMLYVRNNEDDDIDPRDRGTKSGKERAVPFDPEYTKELSDYLNWRMDQQVDTQALFLSFSGKRLTVASFGDLLKRIGKRAGLKRGIGSRLTRHTMATHMAAATKDIYAVKDMLGHHSVTQTEIYANYTAENSRKIKRASPPLY